MQRTTISLPDDLARRLRREARRRGTSVSAVTREVLNQHFGLAGIDEPREVPFAGIATGYGLPPAEDMEKALSQEWADAIEADRG